MAAQKDNHTFADGCSLPLRPLTLTNFDHGTPFSYHMSNYIPLRSAFFARATFAALLLGLSILAASPVRITYGLLDMQKTGSLGLATLPATHQKLYDTEQEEFWHPTAVVWGDALWVAYSVNKEDVVTSKFSLEQLK